MKLEDAVKDYNFNREEFLQPGFLTVFVNLLEESTNETRYEVLTSILNYFDSTAVHKAAFRGNVRVLKAMFRGFREIQIVASVQQRNQGGFTALHYAAEENHPNVINFLLASLSPKQKIATVEIDQEGFTALHHAACHQQPEAICCLLRHVDIRQRLKLLRTPDKYGETALHMAAEDGNVKVVSCILNSLTVSDKLWLMAAQNNFHETPYDAAVYTEQRKDVSLLDRHKSWAIDGSSLNPPRGKECHCIIICYCIRK